MNTTQNYEEKCSLKVNMRLNSVKERLKSLLILKFPLNLQSMNAKSFKIIFALLSFSLLFILLIQAFWIRSFYQQKSEDFNSNVYQSFEKIAAKLKERENLQIIKESIVLQLSEPQNRLIPPTASIKKNIRKKTLPNNLPIVNTINAQNNEGKFYNGRNGIRIYTSNIDSFRNTIINLNRGSKEKSVRIRSKIKTPTSDENVKLALENYNIFSNNDTHFIVTNAATHLIDYVNYDSIMQINYDSIVQLKMADFYSQTNQQPIQIDLQDIEPKKIAKAKKKEEIKQLLGKIASEIKYVDASSMEKIETDTLNRIIKNTLLTKGITTPFEFLLKKQNKGKDTTITFSNGFNTKNIAFEADMSLDKIFNQHNILQLQFPNQNQYVFANIKNALLLSILFSLLIIGAFYYAIKLILQQKKLSEMKNDFINNMTHELKTPIATISLAVDSINNPLIKNDDARFKTYTNILKEENNKLNSHVERVLQMAALDKNELQLHKKNVDLSQIIDLALDAHKLQIQNQNVEIIFNHPNETIECFADAFHLTTAFSNLIDNALKYASENCKLSITIEKNSNQIAIHFKDNGIGIDPALHHKVFEKFYRVSSGNLHDTKGFGLGLSYVKSIIEAHEGQISLSSEKGKGSVFIIKLKAYAS
jgi:signal transduction histidine kinase